MGETLTKLILRTLILLFAVYNVSLLNNHDRWSGWQGCVSAYMNIQTSSRFVYLAKVWMMCCINMWWIRITLYFALVCQHIYMLWYRRYRRRGNYLVANTHILTLHVAMWHTYIYRGDRGFWSKGKKKSVAAITYKVCWMPHTHQSMSDLITCWSQPSKLSTVAVWQKEMFSYASYCCILLDILLSDIHWLVRCSWRYMPKQTWCWPLVLFPDHNQQNSSDLIKKGSKEKRRNGETIKDG